MTFRVRSRIWGVRLSWLALGLAVGSVVVALVAAIGAGQGLWHFRPAFTLLRYTFYIAAAAALLAILAWWLLRRSGTRGYRKHNIAAFIIAALFTLYLGQLALAARKAPPIHDVTTNLADPPPFRALRLRSDNLDIVPHLGREELWRMDTEGRWQALHRENYGDLRTVRVPWSPAETIRRAEKIARDRDWEFARISPDSGTLEATETSTFFRFKDDIVVRARGAPGGGSLVDMRSVSRVGVSDIGVNAERIRSFLAELQAG